MPACEGVRCEAFRAAHIEPVPFGTHIPFYGHGCHKACVHPYVDMPPLLIATLFILFLSICVGLFRIPQYDAHRIFLYRQLGT